MHTERQIALEEPLIIPRFKNTCFLYLAIHHDKAQVHKNILRKRKQYLIKMVWAICQPWLKYKILVLFISWKPCLLENKQNFVGKVCVALQMCCSQHEGQLYKETLASTVQNAG